MLLSTPIEKQLGLQLLQFGPTVLRAAECYKPSVLADYLFQTAQLYSSFYQRSPILKSEPAVRDARLRLCAFSASKRPTASKTTIQARSLK